MTRLLRLVVIGMTLTLTILIVSISPVGARWVRLGNDLYLSDVIACKDGLRVSLAYSWRSIDPRPTTNVPPEPLPPDFNFVPINFNVTATYADPNSTAVIASGFVSITTHPTLLTGLPVASSPSSIPYAPVKTYTYGSVDMYWSSNPIPSIGTSVKVTATTLELSPNFSLFLNPQGIIVEDCSLRDGVATTRSQVSQSSDDVNQDGIIFDTTSPTVWVGRGQSTVSLTGLRFKNLDIPPGAIIKAAQLEVYSPTASWINVSATVFGEAVDNSRTFSKFNLPSQRPLTVARVVGRTNDLWPANTWNSYIGLASIVQEIVNRPGWDSDNGLTLIIKGNGRQWGRKFVTSFEGNSSLAPRLVVTYQIPSY